MAYLGKSSRHFLTEFRKLVQLQSRTTHCPNRTILASRATAVAAPRSLSHSSILPFARFHSTTAPQTASVSDCEHTHPARSSGHTTANDLTILPYTKTNKERVLLLMSGGVDSSMCAYILKSQGYDVTGLYMHNWNHQEETQDEVPQSQTPTPDSQDTLYLTESTPTPTPPPDSPSLQTRSARIRPKVCTSDRDWADVQAVCQQLEIPARRLDFSRQYWNQVFEVMLQEYERGRTPNPDVTCNREIKFGELIEWCHQNGGLGKDRAMQSQGAGKEDQAEQNSNTMPLAGWDYLATGHYARVQVDPVAGQAKLMRALDSNKDQTYYLSTLSERVLRHVLFPLAPFDKPTVKKMAAMASIGQLKNAAAKKESMGICFVGQRRRFGDFLKEYLDGRPGPVRIDGLDGKVIGEHRGLFQYTVGQASGVTLGHQKWVVLRTDLPSNTLIVVDGTQNERLFSPGLIGESWHWIAGHPPPQLSHPKVASGSNSSIALDDFPFTAQIRHRQPPQPCRVEPVMETEGGTNQAPGMFRVLFKDLQRAIAPGQQIVLYHEDECLGGGVIQASLPRKETPEA